MSEEFNVSSMFNEPEQNKQMLLIIEMLEIVPKHNENVISISINSKS